MARPFGTGQLGGEIVRVLDEQGGEVRGIFLLGYRLIGCNDIHWLRVQLQHLVANDVIAIEDHGNGRRKKITLLRTCNGQLRRRVRE